MSRRNRSFASYWALTFPFLAVMTMTAASGCAARSATDTASSAVALDRRVARLIDRAAASRTRVAQQRAFEELEKLGCAAVPAIINRMDDRRRLHVPYIALANKSPRAFEAIRHYSPEEMIDALAAILNQVTGQHFEFIYNGATSEMRTKSVSGWREFLRVTPSEGLCRSHAAN